MTSIIKHLAVADADAAWRLVSDFGGADRAFPGVLAACELADGVRTVTFASGAVVQERLVGIDPIERRLAYHVIGGRFTHHNAAWSVTREPDGGGIATWISDILPDETAAIVEPLMEAGMAALDRTCNAIEFSGQSGLGTGHDHHHPRSRSDRERRRRAPVHLLLPSDGLYPRAGGRL